MGFNRENYRKIREEYSQKWRKSEAEAELRRVELENEIPQLRELDLAIKDVGLRGVYATIGGGENAERTIKMLEEESLSLQEARAALLREHGYPEDYTAPRHDCSKCADTGYIDGKMCNCMRMALIMEGYRTSGIAQLMQTQTFDSFSLDYYKSNEENHRRMKQNLEQAKRFAEEFNGEGAPSLAFFGGTGLGKTHLSTAIAKTVIERGFDVLYVSAMDMLADFEQDRFRSGYSGSGAELSKYFECDLLIVDDLGTEVSNQFTVSTVYNVIDTRLRKNLSTIISTNLTPNDLRSRYWDRITSRILGDYKILLFTGSDVRMQKLKQG